MQVRSVGDALRCILLNTPRSPNLAATRDSFNLRRLPVPVALLAETLPPRKERYTLVWWDGLCLRALGSVGIRAGRRAWQVERLHLPGKDGTPGAKARGLEHEGAGTSPWEGEKDLIELLEGLTLYAGSRGAERVFLRVPYGSSVAHAARLTGFFPYFRETLLQGDPSRRGQRWTDDLKLRPRLPHEEFSLFQLYSASTPSPVRSGLGMTLEQWKDSREVKGGRGRDEVYERDGKIVAWLGSELVGQPAQMEVMVHPDQGEVLPALLDHALARKGVQNWLVPEYQELLRNLLIHRGFREVAHYSTLIKTTAAMVKSPSMTPVEARVW